ncbi:hypothetical protein LPTSP3_g08490 [Leptospira kobayashii]|uniref:DUF2029 domain-containing protein n=1 Tax=Leptospira kobayashii TaxID=1917830 RepID=A0ABN6KCB4_9LEPT|nr:hypothetical protein [Leptospira kobayashii]BDA77919.1 hypothetical protein LPTSP3_g08490 [Leptospira kobayashii]
MFKNLQTEWGRTLPYLFFVLFFSISLSFGFYTVQWGILSYILILLLLTGSFYLLTTVSLEFYKTNFFKFVFFGLILRVILSFSNPIWEDDWARYLWEGGLVAHGISPYNHPPESFFSDTTKLAFNEAGSGILSRINHPDWTTIYFPLIEVYFFLSYKFSYYSLITLKIGYIFFDLAVLYFIFSLKNARSAVLYFLFPILLKEVYANAHFELIPLFFLLFSIWLNEKSYERIAWFVFGLGIHCKLFIVFFIPLLILRWNPDTFPDRSYFIRLIKNTIYLALGAIFPFIFLPALLDGDWKWNLFSVFAFGKEFEFNSLLFPIIRILFQNQARLAVVLILLAVAIFLFCMRKNLFRTKEKAFEITGYFFLLFLILAPIVNPWYFLFLLPFLWKNMDEKPSLLWLVAVVPQMAYLTNTNLGLSRTEAMGSSGFYNLPISLRITEFTLLFIIFLLEFRIFSIILYKISNILNSWKKLRPPIKKGKRDFYEEDRSFRKPNQN